MKIQIGINTSEQNSLVKNFKVVEDLDGVLREETSVTNPTFMIECENPSTYNYCYIEDFKRYYYITDITSYRKNAWRITCSVDVLNSFASYIKNLSVILSDTEKTGSENYLPSDVWKTKVKDRTEIKTFPSGLDSDGEFILITAGG